MDRRFRISPRRRVRALPLLLAVAALALSACKKGDPPTAPGGCEPTGARPDSTWYTGGGTDFGGAPNTLSGDGVTWDRSAGLISFTGALEGFLEVQEPTISSNTFGCVVPVVDAEFQGDDTWSHMPERAENAVALGHLEDTTIAGGGVFSLFRVVGTDTLSTILSIVFSVADDFCELGEGAPGVGQYWIEAPGGPYGGVVTRWSRDIGGFGLIVLGEEAVADSLPRWGMNLWVLEPVREVNGEKVLTVTHAEFTTADRAVGTPDEINARFFVFPPEAGYPTDENDLLRVGYLGTGAITATGDIPMQRQTFSPTGGTTWHEEITLRVCLDALRQ